MNKNKDLIFGRSQFSLLGGSSLKDQLFLDQIKELYCLRDQAAIKKVIQQPKAPLQFSSKDFSGLKDKSFFGIDFGNSSFQHCNLAGLQFSASDQVASSLKGVDFNSSDLSQARLSFSDLSNANFYNSWLFEANLVQANLSGANLNQANLKGANFFGADLSDTNLKDVIFNQDTRFQRSLFKGDPFQVDLGTTLYFQRAKFTLSRFESFLGQNLNFSGSDMAKIEVRDSQFKNCSFNKAILKRSRFKKSSFLDSPFLFIGANLEGAVFDHCYLGGADFKNSNLIRVIFKGCDLTGARFSGSNISNAQFINCQLEDSSLFDHKDFDPKQVKSGDDQELSMFKPTIYDF